VKIIHLITGLDAGGAEAVLVRLVLNDKNNNNLVISMKDLGYFGSQLTDNGLRVETLGLNNWLNIISGFSILKFAFIVLRFKPDAIMSWMYHACLFGGLIGRLLGVRNIIWNILGTNQKLSQIQFGSRVIFLLCKYSSRIIPKKMVSCAQSIKSNYLSHGFKPGVFEVIHNGYDTEEFQFSMSLRDKYRAELSIKEGMPLIGMVARWHPQKNHALLIEALDLVKSHEIDFKCLFIGEDINNSELEQMIKSRGLHDHIFLRNEIGNVPKIMSSLDLHVLSSSFGEGFPNVVAEAMACNVPCIATDIGDTEIMIGDTGWIINDKTPQEMSKTIINALGLMKNKNKWSKLGMKARSRIVENFQISKMVQKYKELY